MGKLQQSPEKIPRFLEVDFRSWSLWLWILAAKKTPRKIIKEQNNSFGVGFQGGDGDDLRKKVLIPRRSLGLGHGFVLRERSRECSRGMRWRQTKGREFILLERREREFQGIGRCCQKKREVNGRKCGIRRVFLEDFGQK